MSDLLFAAEPRQRDLARDLPLISPHGHVDPQILPFDEAAETIADLAYHLPKKVFRLAAGDDR